MIVSCFNFGINAAQEEVIRKWKSETSERDKSDVQVAGDRINLSDCQIPQWTSATKVPRSASCS
jgi:hypothetical protein